MTYDNNFAIQKLTRFVDFQTTFENGSGGENNVDLVGGFGERYPAGTKFYDNFDAFVRTGMTQKHNLTLSGGTDKYTYRLSGNYLTSDGVVPNTSLDRLGFRLSGTAKLSSKFEAQTSLNYVKSNNEKVPKGFLSYVEGLLYYPRTDDVTNYLNADGSRRLVKGTSLGERENPFFNVNKNHNTEVVDRIINNLTFIYNPLKWLSLTSRTGIDFYSLQNNVFYHPESNRNTGVGTSNAIGGAIENIVDNNRIFTSTFTTSAKKTVKDFDLSLLLGSNIETKRDYVTALRGQKLLERDFESINNTDVATQRTKASLIQRRMFSTFGQFNASYKNLVHLGVTGRNDWSSTLPEKNNSFFYPSASLAFEFTEIPFIKKFESLSFGKLRVAYAEVGKDAQPYYVTSRLEAKQNFGGGFGYGFYGGNPDLRPEKTRSYEVGGDVRFFKGRLGIDVAYYSKTSIDQIVANQRISYATGFILKMFNGGKIKNFGTEVLVTATPVQTKNFTWDVSIPFTKNDSKVLALPAGQRVFYLSDTDYGGTRSDYIVGGTTTALAGEDWIRNNNGDILLDPNSGNPIVASRILTKVGDRNPEFTVGWQNNLNYKNVGLSFLFDIRKGGDVYNATGRFLSAAGLSPLTVDNRLETRLVRGVLRDGLENTANPTYSTIASLPATRNGYYSNTSPVNWMEEVNYLQLKDITLSYKFPKKVLDRQKTFSDARLFVTGTDLFILTNYTGADPNTNSLTPGIGGNGGFGVDLFNLPMPATFNFGVRVSLK
ncbi:MAG: SusC/RagA family TonB-linked outer membrane protein [Daejeonella sp.]